MGQLTHLATALQAEIQRRAIIWWSYRLNAVGVIVTYTVAFLLINLIFGGMAASQGVEYGSTQMLASLIGVLFWNACAQTYASIPALIEHDASLGTLENVMLSPFSLRTIMLVRSIALAIELMFESMLMGLVLATVLRLPIAISAEAIVAFLLTQVGAIGVGLALAGLSLIYKRIGQLAQLIANLSLFMAGALVPIDSLGRLFQIFKAILPITWGIALSRQTLFTNVGFADVPLEFIGLTVQTVVFVLIGLLLFQFGWRKARQLGNLSNY